MLTVEDLKTLAKRAEMRVLVDRRNKTKITSCDECFNKAMITAYDNHSTIKACLCGYRKETKGDIYYLSKS